MTGRSTHTLNRIVKAYREEKRICDVPHDRRPRATTEQEDEVLLAAAYANPFSTAKEMGEFCGIDASVSTLKRRLAEQVHTAKRVKQLLRQRSVRLLEKPPKGAYLNIIEHVWARLKKRLSKVSLSSTSPDALWNAVETEWKCLKDDKAPVGILYSSMPSRIEAVIAAEGGMTKY
ncbi:hypothetical protein HPB50_028388 [Hyalomma asiaticum]|nr:hypothetical protein HPB50_028388 [Hyalomma asiaticum]